MECTSRPDGCVGEVFSLRPPVGVAERRLTWSVHGRRGFDFVVNLLSAVFAIV